MCKSSYPSIEEALKNEWDEFLNVTFLQLENEVF